MSKPILMNAESIRAILDGRKTQTRRVIKPLPDSDKPYRDMFGNEALFQSVDGWRHFIKCPCGKPDDTLWVRETWATPGNYDHIKPSELMAGDFASSSTMYRATEDYGDVYYKWRPSIYMPRWASRITLRVKSVRVERVQEISNVDARAEGVYALRDERALFAQLWDSINSKRGFGWDVNPFVWVVEFEVIE